ncbi:MAG: PrsW family glutamic-type intramembrane protease [Firmicutes bacterium]|nr:PrsW family glutamic-type intramembrane protease [Bacillota bacterium]
MGKVVELLALAVAPGLFLLLYLYLKDRHEPEPLALVTRTFFAGALMAVPVVAVGEFVLVPAAEAMGLPGGRLWPWWQAFVTAGLLEETCKLAAVWFVAYRNPNLNEPYDGILYAAAASLGFATIENVAYVVPQADLSVGVARAVLAVPAHAMFGVAMGYYLGRAKFKPPGLRRRLMGAAALAVPVVLHGVYDLLVQDAGDQLAFILLYPLVAFLWVRGLRQVDELLARSPFSRQPGRQVYLASRCPRCGTPLVAGARFCFHCGRPVAPEAAVAAGDGEAAAAAGPAPAAAAEPPAPAAEGALGQ